jgi:hypothetical protein
MVDNRRQILVPVHQHAEEFVYPGDDRGDREAKPQYLICLIAGPS